MPIFNLPSNSGNSVAPGLPVWTYTTGTMTAGKFSTSSEILSSTTRFDISTTAKGSDADWQNLFARFDSNGFGLQLLLTGTDGRTATFNVTDIASNIGYYTFTVNSGAVPSGSWSGDYQLSFATTAFELAMDTGWAPPTDGGDKTIQLPPWSTVLSPAMINDLDTLSPSLGGNLAGLDQVVVSVIKVVKAIQFALASRKLPNQLPA